MYPMAVRSIRSTWTRQTSDQRISAHQIGSRRVITLQQQKSTNDGVSSEKEKECKWMVLTSIITQNLFLFYRK